ncbi:unnamed protein product [Trichobilharzia szidati]|nr:unnamed protein product [Trichobilharzia szidati]
MIGLLSVYCIFFLTTSVAPLFTDQNLKYNLKIKGTAVLDELNSAALNVFSKSGQKFSCSWSSENHSTSANTTLNLSNSVVFSLLPSLNESDCLALTKGWWTYEFCFRKHVVQYHEGSRKSSETLLGVYERDYDWDNSSQNENKPKYHSQFYVNGSVCDLTGRHRKSEVQFLCADTNNFHIISVDEPETCVYLLKISSPSLCTNEQFTLEAPVKTQDIMCHPALSESDYRSYQASIKSTNSNIQSPLVESPKYAPRSLKRNFTYKNMHDKILHNRQRSQLNSFRRSVGQFCRGLKTFSTLYKRQRSKTVGSHRSALFHSNPVNTYDILSLLIQISDNFANFTTFLVSQVDIPSTIPMDSLRVMIIMFKSLYAEVEGYYQVINQTVTPDQAIGLLYAFNLTDIYQSGNHIWDTVSKYSDPNTAQQLLSIVIRAYKKYEIDIPNVEDIPLSKLLHNNTNNSHLKEKFDFKFLNNRVSEKLSKQSGYEQYSKLFPLVDTVKEITSLFLALLKLRVQQFMKVYIELEINNIIEVQLEQTLVNVLTNSKVKVIAVRGGDSAVKRKMKPTAGMATTKNRLKYSRSESLVGQQEIMEMIQKIVTNLGPETSDEFDIFETSDNQAGVSTFFIMPGGPKKKEEKRVRELEKNYQFTFSQGNNGND